jgi:NADPH2:quinone reductase
MRAVICRAWGAVEDLKIEEVPAPAPAADEVLIDVRATSVNYADSIMVAGKYQTKPPFPFSPGLETAGVVARCGARVTRFKPGDRVMATLAWGGLAEQAVAKESETFAIPDGMSFEEAGAFPIAYISSDVAIRWQGRLEAGETLLVLGAAGGAGLSAVELGKAFGARVVAAASSQEKVDLARRHGADAGVIYPPGPFDKAGARALADLFKGACGEKGADVIYDPVGGDYSEAALRAIAWEGRFLVVGFPAGIPKLPLNLTLLKGCQVVGVFWGAFTQRDPAANAANIAELMQLYARGAIKPLVSERYPLAKAGAAIARLASRQAMGKIVVTMD